MPDVCSSLAFTGVDYSVATVVGLALACLLIGIVVVVARRRRGSAVVGIAALLLLGLGLAALPTPASPASAAAIGTASSADCSGSTATVGVAQTSVLSGLAPGVAPISIVGTVTNTSRHRIHISTVVVTITSVSKAAGAPAGSCRARDYRLANTRMPVHATLAAHASTFFTGATIGFSNRAVNQNACKGATIHLRYDLG